MRAFKTTLAAIVVLVTMHAQTDLRAATVVWNAQAAALTLSDMATLDPATNLVMMGYFKTNDSAIVSLAPSPLTLSNVFVAIDISTIGFFEPPPTQYSHGGIWGASVSVNFETLGIAASNIYVWAFNATTIASATQEGIYKFADTFPTETAGSLTIDLNGLFTGGNVLWGSKNQGPGNVVTALGSRPHINLATIPEPSAFMLVGLGLAGVLALRRRRN